MKYVIYGNLERKSNSRQIVRNRRTGKVMSIKSGKALVYCVSFATQMLQYKPYPCIEKGDVELKADIFYRSRRNDLSVEILMDMIQKVGLIKNDRQVRALHIYGKIDKNKPRVEFELKEIK